MGELFCGVGGLSRGFHSLGFQPIFANDAWDLALHNFLMNFDGGYARNPSGGARDILALPGSVEDVKVSQLLGHVVHPGSAKKLDFGDLDVLLGGPPCQGFSLNSHIRSADDPRNHLFRHYVRLLRGLSPKVFVLENVPGMLSLNGGAFIEELVRKISTSRANGCPGYELDLRILNAAHYGVPQERFRIVMVGTRRDVADKAGLVKLPLPKHFSLAQAHFKGGRTHTFHYAIGYGKRPPADELPHIGPRLASPIRVSEAIGDLPPLQNGGGQDVSVYEDTQSDQLTDFQQQMRGDCRVLTNHWCRELLPPNDERVKHIPIGGDWRSIPKELLPPGMQRALRKDHTKRYGRFAPTDLPGTLLTKPDPHWGTFLHYDVKQQRLISVREAARIQSFPDSHTFFGSQVDQYRLCGNAVPPLMAKAVAIEVQKVLDCYHVDARGRRKTKRLAGGR
ncbi:DNA cytosine methyltransferase [Bradyrhizobium sp. IC4061]|uniref:DNA cytosine methyltransferase n=1 Tax=unclassified Bradyrhizobium TaxID=2631580 RepID=UPI0032090434